MATYCTNCGFKLEDNYNFCINCGTKIDKSHIKQQNPFSNQFSDSIEKKKAKQELNRVVGEILSSENTFKKTLFYDGSDHVKTMNAIKQQVEKEIGSGQIKSGGVEFRVNQLMAEYKNNMEKEKVRIAKEKEEKRKKLKVIDEIFESEEIKSEIRKNNVIELEIDSIKFKLRRKIRDNNEKMSEEEIKYYIKTELEKEIIRKEKSKEKLKSVMKKLKVIDEIFESEEIKSEIRENKIGQIYIISIRDSLKNKIINKKEIMSEEEIKHYIKKELINASKEMEKDRVARVEEITRKEKVMDSKQKSKKKAKPVKEKGYCDLSCKHCYEEIFDSDGAIVGDFTDDGYTEYYCHLGHSVSFGSFCEDYE